MCLGSRCVLCDFSNTLGLAEAKTHSVKFLFPCVFKPMCMQKKRGPSDSHSFSLNSTKSCLKIVLEELENIQAANPASLVEALLESLSLNPSTD